MSKQRIGVVGMAVMGKNLALNLKVVGIQLPSLTVLDQRQLLWWKNTQTKI